ncbi:YbfB/YjiJ family MFS transporter [Ancylobacter amanitiformis]|uniref:MFS family arabinose efflux permease n=1 Tax=Ancylobacter amanitiformis TaxID=217069 RepID=A0ABU0LMX5_9HYPH|nr:YbfB/YjiJ family MFS transporter [Ancylobacter amanitiformis]MDQ0510052.1 putative MFS family arabinose efflux permease [Ancylobacter amanitiformis]
MTRNAAPSEPSRPGREPLPWAAVMAGFCASMIGIGLARFAYTPLIPPLIEAGWFTADRVIYLGAANLAGYLVGAIIARALGHRFGNVAVLKVMMLLTALSFLACAFPLSEAWFFGWRLLSGVTGGTIMVLVAATLMPHIPPARRGLAGGAIFLGIGLGIAASGTVVPFLLHWGLRATWLGLAALSFALIALSWAGWPRNSPAAELPGRATAEPRPALALKVLYGQYGLMAVGLVPAMVFLADYVARGLGQGAHVGALIWVVYGIGAILGPVVYGQMGDRLGSARALRLLLGVQAIALGTLLFDPHLAAVAIATLVIGTFPPGIVPLVLHKMHHLLPGDHAAQAAAWSRATIIFATFQALAGYGYSYLFAMSGGSYRLLFGYGALALVLAILADGVLGYVTRRRPRAGSLST